MSKRNTKPTTFKARLLRFPPDLDRKLVALSDEQRRSVNSQIVIMLEQAVNQATPAELEAAR